jgi:hypothetical protein
MNFTCVKVKLKYTVVYVYSPYRRCAIRIGVDNKSGTSPFPRIYLNEFCFHGIDFLIVKERNVGKLVGGITSPQALIIKKKIRCFNR